MTEHRLRVDGQDFLVTRRTSGDRYDFTWLSGPHDPPYGFSMGAPQDHPLTESEMHSAIAQFLANIDPRSGFLD